MSKSASGGVAAVTDMLKRRAEPTIRLLDQPYAFVHATAVQQQDRQFDAATGTPKRLARRLMATASEPHQHILAALNELLVGRLHVHHECLVDAAEQNHEDARYHVERDLLRG